MGKFNTTSFNLFKKENKESIPDWMKNIADNLNTEEKEVINLDVEKRGVFAEKVSVYRPEVTADPRYLDGYNNSRLEIDAKMILSRFLSGKKYHVVDSSTSNDSVSLNVEIDNVGATFNFPFQSNGTKLESSSTFFVDDSEYPFSKAGLNECLSDIKKGTLKQTKTAKSIDKSYVINREEIIRRYNGSLRKATDKINQLLQDGAIVGVGSNSYGTFFNVDELFPQEEKDAMQEKLPEFHFNPNLEHVATNEFKTANYLQIEASKIIKNHFVDFSIKDSERVDDVLKVNTSILDENGRIHNTTFSFAIENEKLLSSPVVEYNKKLTSIEKVASHLNSKENKALSEYVKSNQIEKRIIQKHILTKKDIESKLFKIIKSSKLGDVIDSWIEKGLIQPINSSSYATDKTFSELLASSNLDTLSDDEINNISHIQKHFGEGLEVDKDEQKPHLERVREVTQIESSTHNKLFNANTYLSKYLKNYKLASYNVKNNDLYVLNVELLNSKTGTRHNIPINIQFENNKVLSCVANLKGKDVPLDKMLAAFSTNKVLSLYLQNKRGLIAGPIVITEKGLQNKLASVVSSSKVESVISGWIESGKISKLDNEHIASEHSFQELLATIDDKDIISEQELELRDYQSKHFGKQIKINTDDKIEDTGVRQAEDLWSEDRKVTSCSDKISKLFKEYEVLYTEEKDGKFLISSKVKNPLNGIHLNLVFSFNLNDGKVGEIDEISDENEIVSVNQITNLLGKYVSDTSKEYSKYNKISNISYKSLISRNNLKTKLHVVTAKNNVDKVIESFVENKLIQPVNSVTYASNYTIAELVAMASDKMNLESAKEERYISARNDHKLSISDSHIQDSDSRELTSTVRELDEKMLEIKEKLVIATYKAASQKKITMNKCGDLLGKLEKSKTVKDLDFVSKELKNFYR